jgi:hypothetical protein
MKPHLFRAAVTAAAILLPLQAEADPGKSVPRYIRVFPTADEGAR